MPTTDPVIEARNLTKHYGPHAVVQDVSFRVAAGQTLVLLGPSGCGKTTLLRMLNRLVEPDIGVVLVNGHDVRDQPAEQLRRGMGYVIQQVGLLPHYTVAENVAVVPRLLGHAPAAIAARTTELLGRLHLPPERFAGRYPRQLSGGQQQRVGLARALAADPPIILLDEPFGALDPITRASIRREFRELPELRRKTMVMVTHDVTEAFELADQILLLDAGQVQQLGTPRELLLRPANDFVRRFFAAEQLGLQLRALRLADIMAELPQASDTIILTYSESDTQPLSLTATIQEALAQLGQAAVPSLGESAEARVWVRPTETAAPADFLPLTYATLMAAFGYAVRRLGIEQP
ncbi:glycine/betaine ABC transporter ATP-binding protein [Hymenobacter amundsenii]|uniref:Glycine/betaine ABC transporter ATP-binding protein n=1 Tax=Hymenobacter amundsenii TaxID=2006685 RepID=A0A246FQZ3_9BACT|nr:ABC transporter ATP-binding protein [Hymenobacter amundsenii]OWP65148.1 glycine/betaine ABC transporter ATP-binding protein [Hymenobacter amundsenii]